jgi:PTH2 family peptidyl-tRNA hydrolase
MYKQIIIARKDLHMSSGKLAAQVSHASMAFLTNMIRLSCPKFIDNCYYHTEFDIDKNLYEQWLTDSFTKVVLQAKNKNQLLKVVDMAKELDLYKNDDYFLIYDNCKTELEPEENGKTLTCIGFRPMDAEIIDKIAKKYHVYTDSKPIVLDNTVETIGYADNSVLMSAT